MKMTVSALCLLALSACEMKDEDRCPKGYKYIKEFMICEKLEDEETDQGGDVDSGIGDSGSELDGGVTGTDVEESEIGDPCEDQEDCFAPADYCVLRQGNDVGYCSVVGCEFGDCPDGFSCCDCTAAEGYGGSSCLTDSDAVLAPFIGCICE